MSVATKVILIAKPRRYEYTMPELLDYSGVPCEAVISNEGEGYFLSVDLREYTFASPFEVDEAIATLRQLRDEYERVLLEVGA